MAAHADPMKSLNSMTRGSATAARDTTPELSTPFHGAADGAEAPSAPAAGRRPATAGAAVRPPRRSTARCRRRNRGRAAGPPPTIPPTQTYTSGFGGADRRAVGAPMQPQRRGPPSGAPEADRAPGCGAVVERSLGREPHRHPPARRRARRRRRCDSGRARPRRSISRSPPRRSRRPVRAADSGAHRRRVRSRPRWRPAQPRRCRRRHPAAPRRGRTAAACDHDRPAAPRVGTPPPTATPAAATCGRLAPAARAAAAPGRSADIAALTAALREGLGVHSLPPEALVLTPTLMRLIGRLVHEATRGTVDLLVARAALKREIRAEVTMIVTRENNPLKFSPSAEVALGHLLSPPARGFMEADRAMRDAYDDLRAHQFGFLAGMRAALEGILKRFDPADAREPS